ncbi:MAG: radical SAM protein, partial [Pseudomonadota bacterium]
MAENRQTHVYGPVPSRRLGRSLGVDLVPFKVCSFDCIYCQLGPTTIKTTERREYVPVDELIEDVRVALAKGDRPDYVTLAGSGEPTLHINLDEIIFRIKKLADIPVALLTNGSLFYRETVRRDAALVDVVLPSLDAPNAELFERINRPHASIEFRRLVDGLVQFRREFSGQLWLEVFLLKGLNDAEADVERFNEHIRRIRPDLIHLNTAVRPTAEAGALAVAPEDLAKLCPLFGPKASVAAGAEDIHVQHDFAATRDEVLGMLRRRPCTL